MSEMSTDYEIGDRLKIGGYFCTIKFIGTIKLWPSVRAYGVEWDDHSRGKHSGTIDGIKYFDVHYPNSGSFLKESKVQTPSVGRNNFYKALSEKYGSSSDSIQNLSIGSKKVESFGFEELNARNRDFKRLRKMALRDSEIAILFQNQEELDCIVQECTSVRDLDLSLNLFTNIDYLCQFVEPLRNLRTLDISQNKLLSGWEDLKKFDLSHITHLRLYSCDLCWEHVGKLFESFSAVKILDLSYNRLTSVGIENLKAVTPHTLEELNMSGNNLISFPRLLTDLTLKDLNISNNQISKPLGILSHSIESLDISNNDLNERCKIDDLNLAFPSLKRIHLKGNDLKFNGKIASIEDQATFYEVLARFDHVMVLNGSICDIKTRREAEMYFISKVINNELDYDVTLPRWSSLSKSHEIDTSKLKLSENEEGRQSLVLKIKVKSDEESNSVSEFLILPGFTIRYVKSIICRKLKLDILRAKLVHENCKGILNEINHNFCLISDYNVVNGDIIHVHVACK
ncbi:hypothetical protein SKDZ_05G0760 [Saccharomyces kudriavzevii ZP591]|nr:hypothetical protein SKDZ_05G0760 [Saccharomyces kudriavzevii ZP591]